MDDTSTVAVEVTLGVDLGDRVSYACALDQRTGHVLERFRVASTREAFLGVFVPRCPTRLVVEAGTHSGWASRLLRAAGYDVIVANPRRVRLIGSSRRKSDRMDAELLARLGRADPKLLFPIRHRDAQHHEHLAVLRSRRLLVEKRSALICHVRGTLKAMGERAPTTSTEAFPRRVREAVCEESVRMLEPILQTLDGLTETIRSYDDTIERLGAETYPVTRRLQLIEGVGPLTALAFVLVVEDPFRFAHARSVGAFVGLCPGLSQSGDINPQLPITKTGDQMLRCLLVGAAQYILGPFATDSTLRRYGQRLMVVGGRAAKKRAVVAVARKLAVLLLHLWRHPDETYDALYDAPPLPALGTLDPNSTTEDPA
ncbi:MAG: IS110 family transposase [Planctomycetota bacterium]